jgi:hypothetical protein
MSAYETITVELDVDTMRNALREWVRSHVDEQSFSIFEDIERVNGNELAEVQRAVGAAVLNQILSNFFTAWIEKYEHKKEEYPTEE